MRLSALRPDLVLGKSLLQNAWPGELPTRKLDGALQLMELN